MALHRRAIVINKALLKAAGLSETAKFEITVNPGKGLIIRSLGKDETAVFQKNFEKLNKQYKKLMQNLADL